MINHGPIPEHIQNAPDLGIGLEFWYEAFQKLSTCRPPAFSGVMRIPWTAISMFCKDYDIRGEDREDFEYVMRGMDDALIEYVQDKMEKEKRSRANATPPPTGRARRR